MPLHRALAPVAGHSDAIRPRDWLEVDRARTRTLITLPEDFDAHSAHQARVIETATGARGLTDTAFSGESSESPVWFWQCIADGLGDRSVRRPPLR